MSKPESVGWDGYKHSCYGRERGLAALRHYTRLKTVVVRIREH